MLRKIFSLLSKEDKKSAAFVTLTVIIQAIMEVTGAASIVPLLIVFVNSGSALDNPLIKQLNDFTHMIGIPEGANFTFVLMSFLFVLTVLTFLVRSYSSYQRNLFVEKTRYSLGKRLLSSYLSQDYEYYLLQNANELSKNLLSEVDQVIGKVIYALVNMYAYGLVGAAILLFLLFINPLVAIVTFVGVGGLYMVIYLCLAKFLYRMGQDRLRSNKERFVVAGEIFGGIKAIKVLGKEDYSLQKFLSPNFMFTSLNARKQVMSEVPSYFIEVIGISGLIAFSYYSVVFDTSNAPEDFIPILGLYAYSFYKLKPAVNSIFTGLSGLKYGAKTIDKLHTDLHMNLPFRVDATGADKLLLQEHIQFKDVSYRYKGGVNLALSNVDLEIKAGSSLAVVGSTGSGKSTLINLLLALLHPTEGQIVIDGIALNRVNSNQWQKNIGYVPQDIFMIDASVAENIAFGIPKAEIDMDAVKKAAQIAEIDEFIDKKLDDGYDSVIGDRGIKISGGERQRIGIARALYTNPDILVFDEATSALDSVTEKKIIESIHALSDKKTVIMIAHRLSTVKNCDYILVLKEGKIEALGSYEELNKEDNSFSSMLNA